MGLEKALKGIFYQKNEWRMQKIQSFIFLIDYFWLKTHNLNHNEDSSSLKINYQRIRVIFVS